MDIVGRTMAPDGGSLVAGSPSEFNSIFYTHTHVYNIYMYIYRQIDR